MSSLVYPTLAGLMFGATRAPMWSTAVKTSASGREYRASLYQVPRYKYTLQYEFLRSQAALAELQTLLSFFHQVGGSYDTFLYADADDGSVTSQQFGLGDGVTTAFQLVRTYGSFVEPVYCPISATVQVNGSTVTPASINTTTGIVTFSAAPGAGAVLTWSGTFYWRCRFVQDSMDFTKFMKDLWEARKVEFITVKP